MSKYKANARLALSRGYWVDGAGVPYGLRGDPLKCHNTSAGFPRFSMHDANRGRVHVLVHQLAALLLFGEEGLADDVTIIHVDRNRENNRPENLKLGTRREAQLLIPRHERMLYAVNAASRLRHLTMAQVQELRAMRAAGAKLDELAAAFGIAKSTVSYIVNGKTYV